MTAPAAHSKLHREAEDAAGEIRLKLGLTAAARLSVFEDLERLGLQVVRRPMGPDGPDGIYVRKGDLAVVAINSAKRPDHQRFTACHALGHHHFDGASRIDPDVSRAGSVSERRCNAFAAYLLMPREGAERWLRRVYGWSGRLPLIATEIMVVRLAHYFGMGYLAAVATLDDFGWLAKGEASKLQQARPDRLARQLGYDEFDGVRPSGLILPADYQQRAFLAYEQGDISLDRLAELLRVSPDEASALADDAGIRPADPSIDELAREASLA